MKRRLQLIKSRHNAGLSTKILAQQLEVSRSMISQIENCRCNPSWKLARRLEQFFGIPASELLAETEIPENYITISKNLKEKKGGDRLENRG